MKNQYVGDIGDYGKYSLLRAFAEAGVKIGVNWYLTDDDGSNDGKFKDYLTKGLIRKYSPEVFDTLKGLVDNGKTTVQDVQNSNIIPQALFFSEPMRFKGTPEERTKKRDKWLWDSIRELSGSELVFLDPDNGLQVKDNLSARGAEKFVLPREVMNYWETYHNVVYYCHKGRRTDVQWQKYIRAMRTTMPGVRIIVVTYHKGTQRSYVFLVRKMHFTKYRGIIDKVLQDWDGIFTDEGIEDDDLSELVRDRDFVIYNEEYVTLSGFIKNGCLSLESNVYGKEYDSEKHYSFTQEDTRKLFSIITFESFLESCKKEHLMWLELFLEDNDIHPKIICI